MKTVVIPAGDKMIIKVFVQRSRIDIERTTEIYDRTISIMWVGMRELPDLIRKLTQAQYDLSEGKTGEVK